MEMIKGSKMGNVQLVDKIFANTERLPTLPSIAMRILETIKKDDSCIAEIAKIISSDPSLSAEILRVINSPFFGLRRKVTSVPHALSMLGVSTVKNIALSFSIVKNFNSNKHNGFDHRGFWKSSIISGVAAKILSEYTHSTNSDDLFFLGLLHDIGQLAMVHVLDDKYSLVTDKVKKENIPLPIAEELVFGFSHMTVGQYLVKNWQLPEEFYIPIGMHHLPDSLEHESKEIKTRSMIIYLTGLFVELFNSKNSEILRLISDEAEKSIFINRFDINEVAKTIFDKSQELFPIFDIETEENLDYENLLISAREELVKSSSSFINDFLKQQSVLKKLQVMVNLDSMTNLVNYRYFFELLDQEIYRTLRYTTPLSLILIDIDNFKLINDTYGHPTGDVVIKTIANCIKSSLRETDISARYGGEEFAIILPHTDSNGALLVAERLRTMIANKKILEKENNISVTASFGVTTINGKKDVNAMSLVEQADSALYKAKNDGRNICRKYQ